MRQRLIICAAFAALACSAQPADAAGMTWKDAVVTARKSHPDLVSAREKMNQSEAAKTGVAAGFFPHVSGNAAGTRSKSSSSAIHSDSYSYSVSGSALLFDSFKTYSDVEQAAKSVDADRYNYEVVSSNVRLDLRTAFVDLLAAQELLGLTERIASRRKQSREMIQLRYDAGREHKGSLLTAEANLAQADFEVEQAKRNIIFSQRRFLVRLGKDHFEEAAASGVLDPPAIGEKPDLEKLAETTPFLRELMVLKEAAKWGVRSKTAVFFPSVFADGSLGRTGSSWPVPHREEWSLGVSASVPLFEGGANVAAFHGSEAALRKAEADERSGRHGVVLTLEQDWKAFRDAVDDVAVQKKFLEAAEERSKIAESEYSTGLISFNDWIIIEDNLVSAEKSYLTARSGALLAEAEWEQAKGGTLDED